MNSRARLLPMLTILAFSGCSLHRFGADWAMCPKPPPPYWATTRDGMFVLMAPWAAVADEGSFLDGGAALVLGAVLLLDLPLAVCTDTACLPWDTYRYMRHRRHVRFWRAFFTDAQPLPSADALRKHSTKYTIPLVHEQLEDTAVTLEQLSLLLEAGVNLPDIATHKDMPPQVAERLCELALNHELDEARWIGRGLATNPRTPGHVLARLARGTGTPATFIAIAKNPATPPDALMYLHTRAGQYHDRYLAANPNASVELLLSLAEAEATGPWHSLARNPSTPTAALAKLAERGNSVVLEGICSHPNATPAVLRTVYGRKLHQQTALAANHRTPPDVLQNIADNIPCDLDLYEVADLLVKNPNSPPGAFVPLRRKVAKRIEQLRALGKRRSQRAIDRHEMLLEALDGLRQVQSP